MKKGFTLIELLVVVLIIGILSAVALPQYQAAVDKSRFSTLMALGNSFKNDQELFYLANGRYSEDLNELQPSLPPGWEISGGGKAAGDDKQNLTLEMPSYFVLKNKTETINALVIFYDHTGSSAEGQRRCYAYNSYGDRGVKVCKSLGGVLVTGSNCSGQCSIYRLP